MKGQRSVSTTPVVLIPTLDSLHLRCPCVHMAVSLCSHGCVLVFTWLCRCQSVSNTGQSVSDLSLVFTWLCPCVHMAVSLCSHGCVLVSLFQTLDSLYLTCLCFQMAVSLSVCVKRFWQFVAYIGIYFLQTSVAACVRL